VSNTLVTDTSVLFAALVTDDRDHERCEALLGSGPALVLPAPVVTETCLLAQSTRNDRAAHALLGSVVDGSVEVISLVREDYARVGQLLSKYDDAGVSFVDASVVVVAERLEEDTIATLDRRHFSAIRPAHVEAFTLVP
jgi:hypothetical protein